MCELSKEVCFWNADMDVERIQKRHMPKAEYVQMQPSGSERVWGGFEVFSCNLHYQRIIEQIQ